MRLPQACRRGLLRSKEIEFPGEGVQPSVDVAVVSEGSSSPAGLLFLPPYSPDLNPIEMASSKLKALLRKAPERTVDGLCDAIGRIREIFNPQECRSCFAAAGYDLD